MTIRIGVFGATGRVGRLIIEACRDDPECEVAGAFGRRSVGADAGLLAGVGDLGVQVTDSVHRAVEAVEICIDFTHPALTREVLEVCVAQGKPLVIGTTGLDETERRCIRDAAVHVPIVQAPNMSAGINLCLSLVEQAARALGDGVDIEIIESHHRDKVDAPSGTAIKLGEVAAVALGRRLSDCAVYARHGQVGARVPGSIGFQSIRGGDVVGEHTVLFAGAGERLEITHRSSNRLNFARGALRAAKWLRKRDSGLYDMRDVLGLR